jgi:ABC-type protease/lipase transport system fused ATPase/permease subunit
MHVERIGLRFAGVTSPTLTPSNIEYRKRSMRLNEFKIGVTYQVRTAEWEAPSGAMVPGKTLTRRVLEPVNQHNAAWKDGEAPESVIEQWQEFLRVEDPDTGKVHLLHPNTIETAMAVQ